jgi:hypothetical protein
MKRSMGKISSQKTIKNLKIMISKKTKNNVNNKKFQIRKQFSICFHQNPKKISSVTKNKTHHQWPKNNRNKVSIRKLTHNYFLINTKSILIIKVMRCRIVWKIYKISCCWKEMRSGSEEKISLEIILLISI